jgi:predicted O-methyltransferase YrrM
MFHDIPETVRARMAHLEALDARDREDGTPRMQRLRQIPPVTGRFVALMAAGAPDGRVIEIGTSAGYSALWMVLACRARGARLTTFETMEEKILLARETFELAGVTDDVELVHGDARDLLPDTEGIAFCFLDAEKEVYLDCYELVVPRLVDGGLLLADNLTSHAEALRPFREHAESDPRVDALVVPIGKGILLARRT